jgi:hypothetical protein
MPHPARMTLVHTAARDRFTMATQTQRKAAAAPARAPATGWLTFAAIYMLIAGAMNLIWGITALSKKSYFVEEGLVWQSLELWGWVALIIGAVQVLTSWFIYTRKVAGMIMGILAGMVGTLVNFTSIGAYPVWSGAAILCSVLVLWAVTVHWEEA